MKIRKSFVIIALAFCLPAIAEYEGVTVIDAIELSPANMIIPATVNGMMTYKPCADECERDFERARLTTETTFAVDGRAVKFEEFRNAFDSIKKDRDSYGLLSVVVKTRTVASIRIAR